MRMSNWEIQGVSQTPQKSVNTALVKKMPFKVIKLTSLNYFDRSNFFDSTDSCADFNQFKNYNQRLRRQSNSPYSRLAGGLN